MKKVGKKNRGRKRVKINKSLIRLKSPSMHMHMFLFNQWIPFKEFGYF